MNHSNVQRIITHCRYEIEGDGADWADAEKIALKAAKEGKVNPTVSVKSHKVKRKADQTAAEIYEEELGEKAQKKPKKAKREKGKGR